MKIKWFLIALIIFVLIYDGIKFVTSGGCVMVSGKDHIYSWQCLSKDYAPSNLQQLSNRANYLYWSHELSLVAKNPVEKMIRDAEKDGVCLVVMGGYRSANSQSLMRIETPQALQKGVALPYRSEHQTGLAVDFAACPFDSFIDGSVIRDDKAERLELKNEFDTLPEYAWLVKNAGKYGFEQSYTKQNAWLTGYSAEPWHWKFYVH